MTSRLQQISDATAFDQGDKFETDDQVRDYFTVAEQQHMFGDRAITDQAMLDRMADDVIDNHWHYAAPHNGMQLRASSAPLFGPRRV